MTQETCIPSEIEAALAGLSDRRRTFVLKIGEGMTGREAAIAAGYSAKTAHVQGAQLSAIPEIAAAIAVVKRREIDKLRDEYDITRERVLRQVAVGAFPDVRKLFREDGSPKSIHELDYETSCMIAGIEVVEKYEGSGEDRVFVGHVIKYKLADRRGYVDMLMRHLGEYEQDNAQAGAAAANALTTLMGQMHGSSLPIVRDVRAQDVIDV